MSADTVGVGEVFRAADNNPFWGTRAAAIEAHAILEQSLCMLFSLVTGLSNSAAGTMFFRLGATIRIVLLDKFFSENYGKTYSAFWKSLVKGIREINDTRNKIIHWRTAYSPGDIDSSGQRSVTLTLTQPNFWEFNSTAQPIGIADLEEFIQKCRVYSNFCSQFYFTQGGTLNAVTSKTWLDIFLQPIVYPLPDNHLLSPNYKAP